ncbi:MAG: hypothetical protein ACWGOY_13640 [Anaerolineales bacterium]
MKAIHLSPLYLASLLLLAACGSSQYGPPGPTQSGSTAIPSMESAQSVFGPGTFSIDLPQGWDIASVEINTDPNRPYTLYLLGVNPTSNDSPGISRVAIADAEQWTPEDFVLAQCSTCPQNAFESVTLGGRPALRTEVGGGGVPIVTTWYFVENKGNFIALAIHDPESLLPLEDVLASIKFD